MIKTSVVMNDHHIPYQNIVANRLSFKFIKHIKPDYIDLLGDVLDFYQISKFLTSPERKNTLQDDIDLCRDYLEELRDLAPKSEIILHFGNHVCRLKKYIWKNAGQLDCIRSLDLRFLLNCDKLRIKTIESEEGYLLRGKLVMTHGTIVSQDSGATARRNIQKYGLSVICGHTHRFGAIFKTDLRGEIGGWENGCMCNMELIKEWGREIANWQLGFSIVDFKDDFFRVQQIPIIKNKMMFGKETWQ